MLSRMPSGVTLWSHSVELPELGEMDELVELDGLVELDDSCDINCIDTV